MPASTITYDEVLKDVWGPAIIELLPTKTAVLDMFLERDAKEWGGRRVVYPALYGRSQGVSAVTEEGALPTPGAEKYKDWDIRMRFWSARVRFSAQAMKASEGNKNAFAPVMEREMRGVIKTLQSERGRAIFGDGSGKLALINGTPTTTTVTVKNAGGFSGGGTTNGARFINVGMNLAAVNPNTGAIRSGVVTVTSVAAGGTTFVASGSGAPSGWTDGDYIVRAATTSVTDVSDTSYQKEPMGLEGMVDDGTNVATIHGINRTTVPLTQSYVLSSTGPIAADLLYRGIDVADQRGDGEISDLIMHHSVRRAYLQLMDADRRYIGADLMNPDAGTRAARRQKVNFGGIQITTDKYSPYGTVFGIDRDDKYRYVEVAGEWANEDGNILRAAGVGANGVDSWEAHYRIWEEFHDDTPAENFRLDGVNATIVVAHID